MFLQSTMVRLLLSIAEAANVIAHLRWAVRRERTSTV
jgi:hypothetical protein